MAYYRLYFLDSAARIRDVIDMECRDDATAEHAATSHLRDGQAMELWNQERLVRHFPASARVA